MKKRLAALMIVLGSMFCLACLSSCNSSKAVNTQAATGMAPQKMLTHLAARVPFSERMSVLDKAAACKYYGIEEHQAQEVAAMIGSSATPENAAVWRAKNDHSAKEIARRTAKFYALQRDNFDGARTVQVRKLKNAVILQRGSYVICCVCKDNQKANREAHFLLS